MSDINDFENSSREVLRSSEQSIDQQVLRQLAMARSEAVDQPARKGIPGFLWPVASMTLASLVALVLVYTPITENTVEDEALLSEGFELYEDLEFYRWLADDESQLRS